MNTINTKNIENSNNYFYNLKLATKHLHLKSINDFDIVILPPTGPECICNAGFDYAFIENYNNMKSSSSSFLSLFLFIFLSFPLLALIKR